MAKTTKEHNTACHFEEHRFNENQNIEMLNGEQFSSSEDAVKYATYVREMSDWLAANHADKIF